MTIQKSAVSFLALFLFTFGPCVKSFSQTHSLQPDSAPSEYVVFANPNFGQQTAISTHGFEVSDLLVVVYDMLGKESYSRVTISEKDGYLFSIGSEGHSLHPGVYMIVATINDAIFRQKLIVRA